MEMIYLALGLGGLVLLIWSAFKLNEYSEINYGYTPIGIANILLMFIPIILIIVGFLVYKTDLHKMLAVVFSIVSIIGIWYKIYRNSDASVASGAIFLLVLISAILFALMFANSRNNRYYDDD